MDEALRFALQSRDFPRAKAIATAIIATRPAELAALIALADICLYQGLWDEATEHAQRAMQAAPRDIRPALLGARVAYARGDASGSVAMCDRALSLKRGDRDALFLKATALERQGDWKEAHAALRPLLAGEATEPHVVQIMARCLMGLGDHRGAVEAIDRCLGSFRGFRGFRWVGGGGPQAAQARSRLLFLKAKALDRMADYDGAFDAAVEAKRLVAAPFDPEEYVQRHTRLMEAITRERMAGLPRAKPTGVRHIFIAGMPRSGTTLVEQILDAHPDAVGVGEIQELGIYAARLPDRIGSGGRYPECLAELKQEHVDAMRAEYEAALLRHGFAKAAVYVNKNLDNARQLGLIALVFPEARVMFTRRDPRDIAISCLMSSFRPDRMPALSTVEHTLLAYRQWERLVEHLKSELDLPAIDVQYEELVRDQDAISRGMLDFCGLPWDDRCARFHESGRTVMTLSYDQVNRPIYDSSIGRWKNYEKRLAKFES